jgi:molybdate transport system regulatory protein
MIGLGVAASTISARNALPGEVSNVQQGAVNSEVEVQLAGGAKVVASISKASVERLQLCAGVKVSAIVKASNVLVGV